MSFYFIVLVESDSCWFNGLLNRWLGLHLLRLLILIIYKLFKTVFIWRLTRKGLALLASARLLIWNRIGPILNRLFRLSFLLVFYFITKWFIFGNICNLFLLRGDVTGLDFRLIVKFVHAFFCFELIQWHNINIIFKY